jgi:hypothetical protein
MSPMDFEESVAEMSRSDRLIALLTAMPVPLIHIGGSELRRFAMMMHLFAQFSGRLPRSFSKSSVSSAVIPNDEGWSIIMSNVPVAKRFIAVSKSGIGTVYTGIVMNIGALDVR